MTSLPTPAYHPTRAALDHWYDLNGAPQIPDWEARIGGDRSWVRLARCGQWNADAPDPEAFFSVNADSEATYIAQSYCANCPIRRVCGADADSTGAVGVWGGVYRRDDGRPAALCSVPGCTRYRVFGRTAKACTVCAARTPEMRQAITRYGTPPTNQPVAREVVPALC